MSNFHPNFPYGKGMWIWNLPQCDGGNLQAIIDRCKRYDISYLIIKAGDGSFTWHKQFTREMIDTFHRAGIKVYGWAYNYGYDPKHASVSLAVREAQIAMWALDLGADGFVFNAEIEYERCADPAGAANLMLSMVRNHKPGAFLAHAPFPIIKYHRRFPYKEFGKYCDAVMPQTYWGTIGVDPQRMVQTMYSEWAAWEKEMRDTGNADAIKPIIPIAQGYDNPQTKFVMSPGGIKTFMDGVRGYKSINFWSYQHLVRTDLWEAIRDTAIDKPRVEQNTPPVSQNPTPPVSSTPEPQPPTPPVQPEPAPPVTPPVVPPVVVVEPTPEPSQPLPPVVEPSKPLPTPESPIDTTKPGDKPKQDMELPGKVEVPKDCTTTIEVRHDKDGKMDVKVRYHKTHLDLVIFFVQRFFELLKGVKRK